jgi:hypothetical protein
MRDKLLADLLVEREVVRCSLYIPLEHPGIWVRDTDTDTPADMKRQRHRHKSLSGVAQLWLYVSRER